MKIIVCGPPHSGKSVFIANLISQLPTDAYTIIRACPDGEGTWSNNENQEETSIVRKKGKFTKTFIDDSCKAIDNQINEIVLVDVGGIMSKENEQIFKHCDSFIVLSSDKRAKREWMDFGTSLGLECVGCLDSSLEGEEEIYKREPYLQGKIVGLERGNDLETSQIISALVADIVEKSKYGEKKAQENSQFDGVMIDDTEFGFELGYGKEIETEKGDIIKKVRWPESAIPRVYEAIKGKIVQGTQIKINGVRANFIVSAICKACKEKGVTDMGVYDIRMKKYIPIRELKPKRGVQSCVGIKYNIIENQENIFMDVEPTGESYTLEDYEECILPKIDEDKKLYLSGRMPLWLVASMVTSYESSQIFTFQPGKGYTCVASEQEKDLGMLVDGPAGIDDFRYFEDKQEREKAKKLPVTVEKEGIFAKLKKFIGRFKKQPNENEKYLDDTIKSVVLSKSDEEKKEGNLEDIVVSPEVLLPKQPMNDNILIQDEEIKIPGE